MRTITTPAVRWRSVMSSPAPRQPMKTTVSCAGSTSTLSTTSAHPRRSGISYVAKKMRRVTSMIAIAPGPAGGHRVPAMGAVVGGGAASDAAVGARPHRERVGHHDEVAKLALSRLEIAEHLERGARLFDAARRARPIEGDADRAVTGVG